MRIDFNTHSANRDNIVLWVNGHAEMEVTINTDDMPRRLDQKISGMLIERFMPIERFAQFMMIVCVYPGFDYRSWWDYQQLSQPG